LNEVNELFPEHFVFHNGVTILCTDVDTSVQGQLTVKDYSVVNGPQSLTSFYDEKAKLTDDLRVLVKVVALREDALARTITENSNNQNAIKPRDQVRTEEPPPMH
jgi:AIPR protein